MKVEICIDSVEGAVAAEAGGADRVELCDNLLEGGTTPSYGAIKLSVAKVRIPVHVIIRPRGGDFLYSDTELEVMLQDVSAAKQLGAAGVVIGCLTAAGDIDTGKTRSLIQAARPMSVTFHRAFDMCRDPRAALEELVHLGVDRLLTSGQEPSCLEGSELIAELHKLAADRIIVMPGGGITPRNAARIVRETGVSEIHLSARGTVESGMRHRNTRVFMGGALQPPEYSFKTTQASLVQSVIASLQNPT